jgi:hypothetical protein
MKRQIVMCTFAPAVMGPSGGPTMAEARANPEDACESRVQANEITIAYRSCGAGTGHGIPGTLVPVIADATVSAAARTRLPAQARSPR